MPKKELKSKEVKAPLPEPDIYNLNTGFIPLGPSRTDFLGGTIPFEQRIASGQWDEYLPEKELQANNGLDVMACVSFSNYNAGVESQLNWMIAVGQLKPGEEAYEFLKKNGYIVNGKVNCSDRFLARVSETGPNGNSMQRVADAMRHFGCVPESVWPWDSSVKTWFDYYKPVLQAVLDLGQEFLRYFEYQYEFISGNNPNELKNHLRHAPIQIGTAICPGWKDGGIIKACNQPITHAHMIYGFDDLKYWKDFDHYLDILGDVKKKLAWNYNIPYALKGVVLKKNFIPSNMTTALKLLKNLRHLQVVILPNRNGEMYLMDCSQGKNSWKFHLNEFGLAQQFTNIAHGISNTDADGIRTVESLNDVKHLYK